MNKNIRIKVGYETILDTEKDFVSSKQLSEIKERESKATAGPWACEDSFEVITTMEQQGEIPFPPVACLSHLCLGDRINPENAEFIAHSREDIPRLIEALEKAVEVIKIYAEMGDWDLDTAAYPVIRKFFNHAEDANPAREFLKEFEGDLNQNAKYELMRTDFDR